MTQISSSSARLMLSLPITAWLPSHIFPPISST